MRVIPPLTNSAVNITEMMLTASTVPEAPDPAYNGATNYAENARVTDRAVNKYKVYQSLQDGNVGHALNDPLWWKLVGYTYPEYSMGGVFALDDLVIDVATHSMYKSLVAGNTGNALTLATKWEYVGMTGKWAPFDSSRNTGVTAPSPVSWSITPGERIDALGLAGIVADSYTITMLVDGVETWTRTENLSYRNVTTWREYFFGTFKTRSVDARFDLPMVSEATFVITFERTGGEVTVGTIFPGMSEYLGDVETGAQISGRNMSTVDRKFDGEAVLVPRRSIPTTDKRLIADPVLIPTLEEIKDRLNAVPAFWSGLDDLSENPYFTPLLIVGVWIQFDINAEDGWARVPLKLEEI
jgi:hypothetical protein